MSYFYPMPAGGSERLRRYIPKLKARGLNIQVLTVRRGELPAEDLVDGEPVHRLSVASEKPEDFLQAAWDYFEATDEWPDMIQTVVSFNLRLFWRLWKFRRRGIPLLSTYTMIGNEGVKFHTRLRLYVYYFFANRAYSLFVCGSQAMAQSLQALHVSPQKIRVIPHGVDLERFHPPVSAGEKRALRQQLGLPLDGRILLFVGLLHPRKGVDLLLDAFLGLAEQYPDLCLVLVGGRWEQDRSSARFGDDFEKRISASPFQARITLVGHVPNVQDFLRCADLFVFPSAREGMPNAVLEAMATGLPCILTPFSGLTPELGTPDHDYKLVPRTSQDLQ
ncbi:MAG: glycosyltransferase family 4 protein, partial [Anaerolineae bacterium]|nr:glycosyltransferase family 4 protein [Anaerolineae bacterium]